MFDEDYDPRPSWLIAVDDAWWSVKRRVRLVRQAVWDRLHPQVVAERRRRRIEAAKLLPQHVNCRCVLATDADEGDALVYLEDGSVASMRRWDAGRAAVDEAFGG